MLQTPLLLWAASVAIWGALAAPTLQQNASAETSWDAGACSLHTVPINVTRNTPTQLSDGAEYRVDILYALAAKQILVTNTYDLSARLCIPHSKGSATARAGTIQVLIHGATFSKIMWDFPYQPEKYSFTRMMNLANFPTIAIDLPGSGNSTIPDGLLEAHTQVYVESIHQVIQQLRAGEIGGRKWDKIIVVGFSIGAITANSLAQKYPEDADVILLHGITWDTTWVYPAVLAGNLGSPSQLDPVRWGSVGDFYQTQGTRQGREAACFNGNFDRSVLETDWNTRDLNPYGEAFTFTFHLVTAPAYNKPVFLGIGDNDPTFCQQKCRSQPYAVYDRFPSASSYEVQVYPRTGHFILLHESGPKLMQDSLNFLVGHGF